MLLLLYAFMGRLCINVVFWFLLIICGRGVYVCCSVTYNSKAYSRHVKWLSWIYAGHSPGHINLRSKLIVLTHVHFYFERLWEVMLKNFSHLSISINIMIEIREKWHFWQLWESIKWWMVWLIAKIIFTNIFGIF